MFVEVEYQQSALTKLYIDKRKKLKNEKKSWNSKLMKKLLLTITVANLKRFTFKNKPIIYTRTFVKLYNWRNPKQIYKIYRIIECKKIYILTIKNFYNFGVY